MLKPSRDVLDAAGVAYTVQRLAGPIAETIVERARQSESDMIYMGTRGHVGAGEHGAWAR